MKVKRFNNIWTMGLIIFGTLLIALYLLKMICPQFVVGVAETPSIVKFGNFVDSNLVGYYLFYGFISFTTSYLGLCASCRQKKLSTKMNGILAICVVASFIFERFFTEFSFVYNFCIPLILVVIYVFVEKAETQNIVISTCVTLIASSFGQVLSLAIRDISTLVSYPNSATFFVLAIDAYIWYLLLYLFFNHEINEKGVNDNG